MESKFKISHIQYFINIVNSHHHSYNHCHNYYSHRPQIKRKQNVKEKRVNPEKPQISEAATIDVYFFVYLVLLFIFCFIDKDWIVCLYILQVL